ncbi:MAG: class I SAM-dependent methyltransferase, partial [Bacteroidales bacterium]|nr:class I SAM-dependent methyltransferase [Bacteroidales bacterium]
MNSYLEKIILEKIMPKISYSKWEWHYVLKFLKECNNILDVGCGLGDFIENDPKRIKGIEINEENVKVCVKKGLDVKQGDALNIPFPDNSFDGAFCGHVIQIFDYKGAIRLLSELRRVVKPGGVIVITTFPDHKRLYFTPETFRAYPPHTIRHLIKDHSKKLGPSTFAEYINMKQEAIKLRRPALFEFEGPKS